MKTKHVYNYRIYMPTRLGPWKMYPVVNLLEEQYPQYRLVSVDYMWHGFTRHRVVKDYKCVLMPYLHLSDMKGVPIYEDDIVCYTAENRLSYMYRVRCVKDDPEHKILLEGLHGAQNQCGDLLFDAPCRFRVIGNRWQNPEVSI